MRIFFLIPILFVTFSGLSIAESLVIDPFFSPIEASKVYEQRRFNYLRRLKLKEGEKEKEVIEEKPKLFNISSPPFEKLIFQGVISRGSVLMVVAVDPKSGKIYFFKKGDPVDVNAKIIDVKEGKVIIRIFSRKNGKLIYQDREINFTLGATK